jgi:hypothetical protein
MMVAVRTLGLEHTLRRLCQTGSERDVKRHRFSLSRGARRRAKALRAAQRLRLPAGTGGAG